MEPAESLSISKIIGDAKNTFYGELLVQVESVLKTLEEVLPKNLAKTLTNGEDESPCFIKCSDVNEVEQTVDILESKDLEWSIKGNRDILCIAHLPLNYTDEDFCSLLTEYGPIKRKFLMIDKDDKCKGYGFVEYDFNKNDLNQAKNYLDGKKEGSCVFHCDYLEKSSKLFSSLNSNCLYVDHLPPNYINGGNLRELFSKVATPNYFQLGMKNGQSLGFAVVEFSECSEAEETLHILTNSQIENHVIRVSYCIPGKKAINIYNHFVQNIGKHIGLLPSPGQFQNNLPNSVTSSFGTNSQIEISQPILKMIKDHFDVNTNFKKILNELYCAQNKELSGKPGLLGIAPHVNPLMSLPLQVALISVVLTLQLQQMFPSLLDGFLLNKLLPSNQQDQRIALGSKDKPSLLGNPIIAQANAMLHNISVNKKIGANCLFKSSHYSISSNNKMVDSSTLHDINELLLQVNASNIHVVNFDDVSNEDKILIDSNSHSLTANPLLSSHLEKIIWQKIQFSNDLSQIAQSEGNALLPTPTSLPNISNFNFSQSRSNSKNNYDFMAKDNFMAKDKYLQNFPPLTANKSGGRAIVGNRGSGNRGALLGDSPANSVSFNDNADSPYSWHMNSLNVIKKESLLGTPPKPTNERHDRNKFSQEKESLYVEKSSILGKRTQHQISGNAFDFENNNQSNSAYQKHDWSAWTHPNQDPYAHPNQDPYGPNQSQAYNGSMESQSGWTYHADPSHPSQNNPFSQREALLGNPYDWNSSVGGPKAPIPYAQPPNPYAQPPNPYTQSYNPYNTENRQPLLQNPGNSYSSQCVPLNGQAVNDSVNNNHGPIGPPVPIGPPSNHKFAVPFTPAKRKTHLLPSPETSPEGIYVGQHSQGIGGHYAESYKRRRVVDFDRLIF